MDWVPYIFPAIVCLMILLAVFSSIRTKRRAKALEQIAGEMGFAYERKPDRVRLKDFSGFYIFSRGRGGRMKNLIHGSTEQLSFALFDYSYSTGSGKNQSVQTLTVACFDTPDLHLPTFALRPQHLFHAIGEVFGLQDIDFDPFPVFSRSYLLQGEDEDAVRALFERDLIEHFQRQERVCAEGRGQQLLFYRQSKKLKPERFRDFLEEAFAVYELVKRSQPPT